MGQVTVTQTEAVWLSEPQQRAWRAYINGSTLLFERLDRDLREQFDVSLPEYEILVRLSESPHHSMRMAVLASSVSHSRSRVTHTISRLERKGLVSRRSCPTDGRGVIATLTPTGWERLVAAAPVHVDGVRRHLVEVADADDLAAVGRVFAEVGERLSCQ
jgi:DNA-binding MarR family transcriptional regulator